MHAIDIRKYEVGVHIGGSKGEVKLCPHCNQPGCRIGSVQRQPKVAHTVAVGYVSRTFSRGANAGKTVTALKAKWGDVCGLPKKLSKQERAEQRRLAREERKAEKKREREEMRAAKKVEARARAEAKAARS